MGKGLDGKFINYGIRQVQLKSYRSLRQRLYAFLMLIMKRWCLSLPTSRKALIEKTNMLFLMILSLKPLKIS